jgi:hypothetical protein
LNIFFRQYAEENARPVSQMPFIFIWPTYSFQYFPVIALPSAFERLQQSVGIFARIGE